MPPVFVRENISNIEDAIRKFTHELSELEKRKEEIKTERSRLEGCLLTFEGFAQAGIEEIVPEQEKQQHPIEQGCGNLRTIEESDQEQHNSCSDQRVHTHEHNKGHDKTPLEELYAKYRTM